MATIIERESTQRPLQDHQEKVGRKMSQMDLDDIRNKIYQVPVVSMLTEYPGGIFCQVFSCGRSFPDLYEAFEHLEKVWQEQQTGVPGAHPKIMRREV